MAYVPILVLILVSVILNRFFARNNPKLTWLWTKRLILVFTLLFILLGLKDSSFFYHPLLNKDYNCTSTSYEDHLRGVPIKTTCGKDATYSLEIDMIALFLLATTASIVLWSFWDDYKKRK